VSTMQVFVSHSHQDHSFCLGIVAALRRVGAEVWYDEHNLASGHISDAIDRELIRRPVVVVILSQAALASSWVRNECMRAYELLRRDPSRIFVPVTAGPFEADASWLFLSDFKRIEAPGMQPFPLEEACVRLLRALALTPAAAVSAAPAPKQGETLEELLGQGKALMAQQKDAEARAYLERATECDPRNFDAWANLGLVYRNTNRYREALAADDRALALDDKQAWVWNNKGKALSDLQRYDEALAAYDRALALEPRNTVAWNNKGTTLSYLDRYNEALAAYDRALMLDPQDAIAWNNKADGYNMTERYAEGLASAERALAIDPRLALAWGTKGRALEGLSQYVEALAAYVNALSLKAAYPYGLEGRARVLRRLGRTAEEEHTEQRAKELGGQ
jgi:tetratricopeptide (TPR) repeat protein